MAHCHREKEVIVYRQHLAVRMLDSNRTILNNVKRDFRQARISSALFLATHEKAFDDSVAWQKVYDSCKIELDKF
jgi:hypothetical protein